MLLIQNHWHRQSPKSKGLQQWGPRAKKPRSTGVLLDTQYQKAINILSKIAKNREPSTVDKWDQKDLAKYQPIFEEYYNESLENQ